MLYLIAKIFFCLVAAALVGLVIGWFLRNFGRREREDDVNQTWRRQLDAAELDKNRLAKDFAAQSRDLKRVRSEHAACAPHIAQLNEAIDTAKHSAAEAAVRTARLKQRLAEGESALEATEKEVTQVQKRDTATSESEKGELQRKISALEKKLSKQSGASSAPRNEVLQQELEKANRELSVSKDHSARLARRVAELEGRRSTKGATSEPAGNAPLAGRKPTGSKSRAKDKRTGRSARTESTSPTEPRGGDQPGWLLSRPDGEADDLKKIKGVGSVLERTLNQLGVYHYRQIAGFQERDINWVSKNIKTFPGRIERDDWTGQAKKLDKEKSGRNS